MIARTLLCLCLTPLAVAQKVIWDRDGVPGQNTFMGLAFAIGDLNGDGWEDVAAIAEVPTQGRTQLWLLSGRDGTTLRVRTQPSRNWWFEGAAATGDMNGDGVGDYAASSFDTTGVGGEVVEVSSGVDDARIWMVQRVPFRTGFGTALLGDLDLDGDGRRDLVVTNFRDFGRNTAVYAYDNAGRELYSIPRLAQGQLGYDSPATIGRVGDWNGDGRDDYAVGADTGAPGTGALVFSGPTGQVLQQIVSTGYPFDALGWAVRAANDLDGDGVRDLVISSTSPGVVVAFSGRTGQEIRHWPNPAAGADGSTYGFALAVVDLDRDGVDDVLVGGPAMLTVPPIALGRVFAYSGRDGGALFEINDGGAVGAILDPLRSPANDPFPLFVTSMQGYVTQWSDGRIRVYRAKPKTVTIPGGPPCQGGLPLAAEIGLRDLSWSGGRGVRVHLSDAPPGVNAWLFLGLSNTDWNGVPLPFDLSLLLGLPAGCALQTSIDAVAARATGMSGLDRGVAWVDLPLDLSALGTRVYAQWILFGPGNAWPGGLTRPLSWQLAL